MSIRAKDAAVAPVVDRAVDSDVGTGQVVVDTRIAVVGNGSSGIERPIAAARDVDSQPAIVAERDWSIHTVAGVVDGVGINRQIIVKRERSVVEIDCRNVPRHRCVDGRAPGRRIPLPVTLTFEFVQREAVLTLNTPLTWMVGVVDFKCRGVDIECAPGSTLIVSDWMIRSSPSRMEVPELAFTTPPLRCQIVWLPANPPSTLLRQVRPR